jgi:hypothetical protein
MMFCHTVVMKDEGYAVLPYVTKEYHKFFCDLPTGGTAGTSIGASWAKGQGNIDTV